jgi:hypothetical protein
MFSFRGVFLKDRETGRIGKGTVQRAESEKEK